MTDTKEKPIKKPRTTVKTTKPKDTGTKKVKGKETPKTKKVAKPKLKAKFLFPNFHSEAIECLPSVLHKNDKGEVNIRSGGVAQVIIDTFEKSTTLADGCMESAIFLYVLYNFFLSPATNYFIDVGKDKENTEIAYRNNFMFEGDKGSTILIQEAHSVFIGEDGNVVDDNDLFISFMVKQKEIEEDMYNTNLAIGLCRKDSEKEYVLYRMDIEYFTNQEIEYTPSAILTLARFYLEKRFMSALTWGYKFFRPLNFKIYPNLGLFFNDEDKRKDVLATCGSMAYVLYCAALSHRKLNGGEVEFKPMEERKETAKAKATKKNSVKE